MKRISRHIIPKERKKEINDNYSSLIDALKQHRKKHKDKVATKPTNLEEPAWVRISPGSPIHGNKESYRLCIGFKNIGCKYREKDPLGLGCLICGYYARTAFRDVNSNTIIKQFVEGLRRVHNESTRPNSVEFLNDGSFLNPEEFDKKTQIELFKNVKIMPHVLRVLVETRPEYIKKETIEFLINNLRHNQLLEIGIGLESANSFIREKCINKGFTLSDFENSLKIISNLYNLYPKRLGVVAYLIIKPPFLTHKECIKDIIESLKYLQNLNNKYNFRIVPKLEPAAISNGTILSMLHKAKDTTFYYEPLNYWAVLEILARAYYEFKDIEFEIRIGAREDMDDVIKAPAVYNKDGETFHPFDFVIYESIQKFNQHQNYLRLFAVIDEVYQLFNDIPLKNQKSPLMKLLKENGIKDSSILRFIDENILSLNKQKKKQKTKNDIEMMKIIYRVLDILEGLSPDYPDLKKNIDKSLSNKYQLENYITECFEKVAPKTFVKVNIVEVETITTEIGNVYAGIFFDVTNLHRDDKLSVWSRFSLSKK